jgi:hypothetical protein
MTDDERKQEGAEEEIEDLEAAAEWADVAGGIIQCHLPTVRCSNPTCTSQTYCKAGTLQGCQAPSCHMTTVEVA